MPAETSSSYSRELITNGENREKAVQEMRAEKGHVTADKAKTPEQKKELSEKWLKRAGLTDGGGKAEIMKLLGNPKTPEEFVAAVEKKQEEYGLKKDGILGWATLEKMDGEVDQSDNDDEFDSYTGLARAEAKAAKAAEEATETQDKKQQLAELQKGIDDGTVYAGETKTDPNGREVTLQETKDGKKWVVTEEGDMKGRVLNTETGEYESATDKDVDKKQQLAELQKGIDDGTVYAGETKTDPNGREVTLQETKDGKKWVVTEEGDMKGRVLNTETGEYEGTSQQVLTAEQIKKHGEEFATRLRGSKEGATDLKDVHGDPVKVIEKDDRMVALGTGKNEGRIYNPETGTYEITAEQIKKHGEEFATRLRGSKEGATDLKDVHGDPVKVIEKDDRMVALGTGKNEGRIYNPETGTYEITEEEKEKKLYEEYKEYARGTESLLGYKDGLLGFREEIRDMKMSEISADIDDYNGLDDKQRIATKQVVKNAGDLRGIGDMTYGEYLDLLNKPLIAASRLAPTDKPGKLPGKLGEYGATYQRGNLRRPDGLARENTFVYREGKVPQVIVDGEAKNINTVYTAPGVYKLPNGELYRVTMSDEGSKMAKVKDEFGNNVTENVTSDGNLAKVG